MESPAKVEFQGIDPNSAIREDVARHIDELEKRFGRITACRVVVGGAGGRHQTGGLYEIKVHLTLPHGKDVTADHTPHKDERHADLHFAVNDAFKRARRQLEDQAGKLHRKVKHHEPTPAGRVARLDPSGEFGFIATPSGTEIYFHRNSVLNGAFDKLEPGTQVAYAEETGEKGPQASTVRLLGKHMVP